VAAGLLWSGYHLSVANFLFDAVTPQKRARCVAYYNVVTNVGMFVGATAGGALATVLPDREALQAAGWPLISGLQLVFIASGVLRLIATLALLPLVREVREVQRAGFKEVIVQIIGTSPLRGARLSVFGGAHPSERPPPVKPKPRE
jgi:MFS family permease